MRFGFDEMQIMCFSYDEDVNYAFWIGRDANYAFWLGKDVNYAFCLGGDVNYAFSFVWLHIQSYYYLYIYMPRHTIEILLNVSFKYKVYQIQTTPTSI
jgi:hypothetical protein